MRKLHRLLAAIPAALALSTAALALSTAALALSTTAVAADFEPGQVWSAKGREKDGDVRLLVLKVEREARLGVVLFVAVSGIKLCLPTGQCGDQFSPLAMTKLAVDQSVKEEVGRVDQLPEFEKGYQFWKEGVAKGVRVTITVPLAEALDQIESGAKIEVK